MERDGFLVRPKPRSEGGSRANAITNSISPKVTTRSIYRAKEFAELAGVTVRALHHYESGRA